MEWIPLRTGLTRPRTWHGCSTAVVLAVLAFFAASSAPHADAATTPALDARFATATSDETVAVISDYLNHHSFASRRARGAPPGP